jgi:hypothetical protein
MRRYARFDWRLPTTEHMGKIMPTTGMNGVEAYFLFGGKREMALCAL